MIENQDATSRIPASQQESPEGGQTELEQFDQGFEWKAESEPQEQPGKEDSEQPLQEPKIDQAPQPQEPPASPRLNHEALTQPEPEQPVRFEARQQPVDARKSLETVPDEIADEFESLKKLNPAAAELAMEDSPEGASIRARLEQYGAELAQDRAETLLYQRAQRTAEQEARRTMQEQARAAHNAAFKAMFERDHPEYAAMMNDPGRRAEAVQYQQSIFDWIAAKPYSEAAELMEIAKNGRDPEQVSALITRFEREKGVTRRADPTGALAVPGRGAPIAPTGVGDKDDFDAGWNANL